MIDPIERLHDEAGDIVLRDPDVLEGYAHDITGRYRGRASAVARPRTVAQLEQVLTQCARHRIPVVPQGGNTGLSGGAIPFDGELVVSTRGLDQIEDIDLSGGQATVQAGVTLASLQQRLAATRWMFGVDHGARDSATLGGMAATNAGGARVLRYGAMREQIIGLEAVMATGHKLSRLSGLVKDTAGYDTGQLLVGSEGTLGIITRLRLRLRARPAAALTVLVGLDGVASAARLAGELRSSIPSLSACELFLASGLELVMSHLRVGAPFPEQHSAYVLLECDGDDGGIETLAATLDNSGVVDDQAVADDTTGREKLWRYREAHNEAVNAAGVPHKLDISVPLSAVATMCERTHSLVARSRPDARVVIYGHLGDGNLHINLLGLTADDPVDHELLEVVAELGGSISAEHGVGIAKTDALRLSRSPSEIDLMWAIKAGLDPLGLMNPGKVLGHAHHQDHDQQTQGAFHAQP